MEFVFNHVNENLKPEQLSFSNSIKDVLKSLPDIAWEFRGNGRGKWKNGRKENDYIAFSASFERFPKEELEKAGYQFSVIDRVFMTLEQINKDIKLPNSPQHQKHINVFKTKDYIAFYSNERKTLHKVISFDNLNSKKVDIIKELPEKVILGNSNHEQLLLKEISGHIEVSKREFYARTVGGSKILYWKEKGPNVLNHYSIYRTISI